MSSSDYYRGLGRQSTSVKDDYNNIVFSVIVAVWNGASTLQRCIDSVASQTYAGVELIVIDGGSTDGTRELLEGNAPSIAYWESEPDRGITHAWNKGLKHIHGDWVCFLGADDFFWDERVLEKTAGFIQDQSDPARVAYGMVNVVDDKGDVLGRYGDEWSVSKRHFFESMTLPHQGVFHHRSLFEQYGPFDESYRITADYEFLLRELNAHAPMFIHEEVIAGMGVGGVSSNPKFALQALSEIRRAVEENTAGKVGCYWRGAYVRAWLRKVIAAVFGDKVDAVATRIYRRLKKMV